MQVSSLKLKGANEMTVYKRHGLHTKAQNPKIKVPQRNGPTCTLVPASTFPRGPKQANVANGINILFILLKLFVKFNTINI